MSIIRKKKELMCPKGNRYKEIEFEDYQLPSPPTHNRSDQMISKSTDIFYLLVNKYPLNGIVTK